jgi:citrate synthase
MAVLDSSLTLINEGRIFYRGRDALELARRASVEEVAALLWTGDPKDKERLFTRSSAELPQEIKGFLKRSRQLGPVERCQLMLPLAASVDLGAYDLRPKAVARTGARILNLLVGRGFGPDRCYVAGIMATTTKGSGPGASRGSHSLRGS